MPYALCPMPYAYALCPVVPHMRARKAIFYTKNTTLSSIYYVLKLEGDFKVSVYREVNGENKREILSEQNFEKCQFSEPVKILPINLFHNEKAGRIYSRLQAYRLQ